MKTLPKYITEKLIINRNFPYQYNIDINDYESAKNFVIIHFFEGYSGNTLRYDIVSVKTFNKIDKTDYIFKGTSKLNDGDWNLKLKFYNDLMLGIIEPTSTYIIYPLSYFKKNVICEYFLDLLENKMLDESPSVTIKELNEILHINISDYMYKCYKYEVGTDMKIEKKYTQAQLTRFKETINEYNI